MATMLRGLVVLLVAASALLQVADAKSCGDDLDCPLKQCCTGNVTKAGVCSSLIVNGKQVCPSCKSFPGRQLACPKEASVCCGDGICRKSAADCQCLSDAQCPLDTCCTGTKDNPGHCSPQAYVKGKYVCKDCQSRAGPGYNEDETKPLSCPKDASVCCRDGICAKTLAGCKCSYTQNCPLGSCCSSAGTCSALTIVNGKQTCPDCGEAAAYGALCPKEASVCCRDGTCAKSADACPCSSKDDCDESECCTGNVAKPGKCSKSAFVGGKQVCKDCHAFGTGAAQKCPKSRSVCCSDGTCHSSAATCGPCKSARDCPANTCCTGDTTKPGNCVAQAFVGGEQVCKGCGKFGGKSLACPKDKKVCCSADYSCSATLAGCPCLESSNDEGDTVTGCGRGTCCTGNSTVEGVCSSSVLDKAGKQVCHNCKLLKDQGLACPKNAPFCCGDGSCKATAAACSCSSNYNCPDGHCCSVKDGAPGGHCVASLFVKGKQACPACVIGGTGAQACPKATPVCCADGSCQISDSHCSCGDSLECPSRMCCTGFTHSKRGVCTAQPFVNGKQVCPDCDNFFDQDLECPESASECCSDGFCRASTNECTCTVKSQCPYDSCCTSKGTCSSQPIIKGVQVCPNCTTFTCPSSASKCCADGLCKAKC